MSDLISRSAVIEVLKQTGIIQDNNLGHLVIDEINRIPTAYNVEKVVAELEEYMEEAVQFGISGMVTDMIEVVRNGGVE